ncbi:MAG: tryptophan synthase subunit alpha, partial [Oscillospiraceae bacterium]
MNFNPIYYICVACPTISKTLEMVDKYVAHGAKSFQIDMPSKDPYAETEFVKTLMKNTLNDGSSYDDYMGAIREIRRRHTNIELHVVVYHDVVETIGLKQFVDFGKEINVASFMIPNNTQETADYIEANGIIDMKIIVHAMPANELEACISAG